MPDTASALALLEAVPRHHDARSCRGRRDEGALFRAELTGEERDGAAARDDAALADEGPRLRRGDEVDLQLESRRELIRLERGRERGAERVVEHRREGA